MASSQVRFSFTRSRLSMKQTKGNWAEQSWVDIVLLTEEMETQAALFDGSVEAQFLNSESPVLHCHVCPAEQKVTREDEEMFTPEIWIHTWRQSLMIRTTRAGREGRNLKPFRRKLQDVRSFSLLIKALTNREGKEISNNLKARSSFYLRSNFWPPNVLLSKATESKRVSLLE